jgi:hypothetical protein
MLTASACGFGGPKIRSSGINPVNFFHIRPIHIMAIGLMEHLYEAVVEFNKGTENNRPHASSKTRPTSAHHDIFGENRVGTYDQPHRPHG